MKSVSALGSFAALLTLAACTSTPGNAPSQTSTSTQEQSSASSTAAGSASAPEESVDPRLKQPAPPLGKDLACYDRLTCYLKNPDKLNDEQWEKRFAAMPAASAAPAAKMRPWAFVVLGLEGEQKLALSTAADPKAPTVPDRIGIMNHRALFAYCRATASGQAPDAATSRKDLWYQVEPISTNAPDPVWMNGEHLYAYGHDGQIPTC